MTSPQLVKDIRPGSNGSNASSLFASGKVLLFAANDGNNGGELWRSDGTAAGTFLVKDINVSPGFGSTPSDFVATKARSYFLASDGRTGKELWQSDGTASGTVRVLNANQDGFRYVYEKVASDDALYFVSGSSSALSLWSLVDGESEPIGLEGNAQFRDPTSLRLLGNTLFFSAKNSQSGRELWKTDGSALGTVLVKDIRPGGTGSLPYSSNPRELTTIGDELFFTVGDESKVRSELWKTDGTEPGTVLVKDISNWPGTYMGSLVNAGNTLFFKAQIDNIQGSYLWVSDGTVDGTLPLDSEPNVDQLTAVDSLLFFAPRLKTNNLWRSDGTVSGTFQLTEDFQFKSELQGLTAVGSNLYFSADDGISGRELWRSDGTSAGTVRVSDLNPGAGSSNPRDLTVVGDTLFFIANDGVNGEELWSIDLASQSPTLALTKASVNEVEGDSGSTALSFMLVRNGSTAGSSSVSWAVTGTGEDPADAEDFAGGVLPGGTVSFTAGETTKTITVNVAGDQEQENDEQFMLTLSNPSSGASITQGTAIGTIRNDDASLAIAPASANKLEGQSGSTPFTFKVTRSGYIAGRSTAAWAVSGSGSTAASASDFAGNVLPTGTVSFAAGQTTKTVTVNVAGDSAVEPDEGFTVTLTNPSGATLLNTSASGIIRNDDTPPSGDSTPPVISGITVQGGELLVQFSEPIDSSGVPTSRFAAKVGTSARTITAIQAGADASQLRLTLSGTAPSSGQAVRLAYSDPAGNQTTGVIQDAAGNDMASIAAPGRAADTFNSATAVSTLASTTSNLNLLGSAPIKGTGNSKANTITGNSGNNLLNGLGGNDVITGGLGGDTFRFSTALSASGNRDQITDFTPAQGDRIQLENGIFKALPSTGTLAAAAFTIGSGATTAAHRIIYNPITGTLSYDSNGNVSGGSTVFATLTTGLALTNNQFTIT